MGDNKLSMIVAMVGVSIVFIIVFFFMAVAGISNTTDGCLHRYNYNEDGTLADSDQLSDTVILKANANYSILGQEEISPDGMVLDPSGYGKWLNTNLRVSSGQKVKFTITGDVSLCKSYVPINNVQTDSDKDNNGNIIPIPAVEDKLSHPVSLYFDAKTDQWRNLAQVFKNDKILVSLLPDQKTSLSTSRVYNSIKQGFISADCREGKREYNPICGRYSLWKNSNYVSSCSWESQCEQCECRSVCSNWDPTGQCFIDSWKTECKWCGCYKNNYSMSPEPYANDGKYTSPWYDNIESLIRNYSPDCKTNHAYIDGEYQNQKYFWFSADNAAGLLYRFDSNINPTNASSRGYDYSFAKVQDDKNHSFSEAQNENSSVVVGEDYKVIMDLIYTDSNVGYLQYRFHDGDGNFADNTGGYVFNINHTKCRRLNGNGFDDVFENRGAVQYVIANYGSNPNNTASNDVNEIIVDANGAGELEVPSDSDGYLWLKINNKESDYQDSVGQYGVQFSTSVSTGHFYEDVLDPFFTGLKTIIKDASITIFKNMTCYQGIGDSDNCTNFFQYIKFMLIIYIMFYGMMFLLGMVKINQTDLVIRVVKIGIVAGLINDQTFEFFNSYVFDLVTGFSDDIMSNIAGYSIFAGDTKASNPFQFLDAVMTKIFFSATFSAQMMSFLVMGLNGVFYFILVFVCLCIIVIVSFRAITVYLMAFMAISVLIGIAPLFLSFILFERTRYLFDNWVKFMVRYMLEPVIVLAGIIILTQLFTIYLDMVVGTSVCWKCAIPIKIPFPQVEGVTPALLDLEIFCINWFAPWGFDHRSGSMGINMQNIIVLMIIANCIWGYLDFANRVVARLAGGQGGPSAIRMGNEMFRAIEQKALSQVGLDYQSRAGIKEDAKSRAKSMRRGDEALQKEKDISVLTRIQNIPKSLQEKKESVSTGIKNVSQWASGAKKTGQEQEKASPSSKLSSSTTGGDKKASTIAKNKLDGKSSSNTSANTSANTPDALNKETGNDSLKEDGATGHKDSSFTELDQNSSSDNPSSSDSKQGVKGSESVERSNINDDPLDNNKKKK